MRYWAPMIVVLALAACAQPAVPPDRFYRIEAPAPPRPNTQSRTKPMARPPIAGVLLVEDVSASGLISGRALVHADSARPNALEAYSYHYWAEPPAHMLRDELVRYLRAAGIAGSVVTETMRVDPDHALVARLLRLERLTGAEPRVVMELEIALRDDRRGTLLEAGTYRAEVAPADDTLQSAVDAFSAAFAQIASRLAADLSGR